MGWNEWPLMLFTVLAQSAVGAYWFAVIFLLIGRALPETKLRLERAMLLIWVVMGMAFLCSSAHLGSPMRALNVLSRVGQTPLSNEVLFGMLFMACGGCAWLLALKPASEALRKGLYVLGLALSAAFLWNMTAFYLMPTLPTWNTPLTPLAFAVTALLGGAALMKVLLGFANSVEVCHTKALTGIAVLAFIAAVIVTIMLIAMLPEINTSVHQAGRLVENLGRLMALRFLLLSLAVGLMVWQTIRGASALPLALTSFVLVLVGEIVGRGVFYGLHMTTGVV